MIGFKFTPKFAAQAHFRNKLIIKSLDHKFSQDYDLKLRQIKPILNSTQISMRAEIMNMISIVGLSLIAFMSVSGIANAKPSTEILSLNGIDVVELTRSQCLKKKGYIWIPETGKCVRDTRGSY